MIELLIQNKNTIYYPAVLDDVEVATERSGSAGKLTCKFMADSNLNISEGNAIRLKVDSKNVFYGFIFTIKRSESDTISVTAYDQLRYLKNKDTYVYTKTAAELIKTIASDFNLQCGSIADTGYTIPSRVEDKQTLFDIIQNALYYTLSNTGKMYILYDDFGKLTLKSLEDMKVNILIDAETAQTYDYSSTIDTNTYNQIKLVYDNKDTGKREVYITKDSSHINEWGLLQYFDTLQKGENGKSKADSLLKLYNAKTKSLTIKDAFGDTRVRAGSLVVVQLNLGDMKLQNYMLVESCTHTFKESEHHMTLKLRGGAINSA